MREVRRPLPDGHRHETLVRLYLDEGETLSPLSLLAELMLASHPLALRCFLKGRIINIDWTAMARLAAIDGNHKAATVALPEAWFFDYVLGYHMKVEFFPRGVVGYRHADADHDPRAPLVVSSQFEPMYGVGSLTEAVSLAVDHPPPPPIALRRSPLPQVAR